MLVAEVAGRRESFEGPCGGAQEESRFHCLCALWMGIMEGKVGYCRIIETLWKLGGVIVEDTSLS
jgi:hypothetical protein